MRYSSFDKCSSDGEEKKGNNNKRYEEKQEEIGICKLEWPIFHLESGDYLRELRRTGFFSAKKRKRRQIRELEKAASNNLSIKTIFVA